MNLYKHEHAIRIPKFTNYQVSKNKFHIEFCDLEIDIINSYF